jgi:hypothetical protein
MGIKGYAAYAAARRQIRDGDLLLYRPRCWYTRLIAVASSYGTHSMRRTKRKNLAQIEICLDIPKTVVGSDSILDHAETVNLLQP